MKHHQKNRQSGSSMLEVLIAIVIFSLGLLGLAGLQVTALKSNQSALSRSVAVGQAYEIMDRMRANAQLAKDGSYDIALGATPSGSGRPAEDLEGWTNQLAAMLPGGVGQVCRRSDAAASDCQGVGDFFVVLVEWSQSGSGEGSADLFNQASQRITVVGQL